MKKLKMTALLVLLIGILTGCTNYSKQYDGNTLIVKRNGSLTEVSVEDFKDTSVNADNLNSYIQEQVDAYNNDNGNMIKMESIDSEDMGHVKLVLSYKDIDSYDAFNLLEYSLMDIKDVKDSDLTGSYTSSEDVKINPSDILAEDKGKVLKISEATDVVVKGNDQ